MHGTSWKHVTNAQCDNGTKQEYSSTQKNVEEKRGYVLLASEGVPNDNLRIASLGET